MIASTPVALGLRNVYKLWPQTALLLTVVGLVVASSMGILSVRATAQFSAREIASIAMGDADLQARFGGGDISSIVHPEPSHDNGIERVLVDTDVQTTLSGDSGAHSLVGRVVPFRDPLTQGIVKFDRQLAGEGQLALSPTAAAQLDVALGDEVEIASDGGTISLTYTDEVRYAGDTSSPFFLVERESVTAEQVNQIESGIDVGTPRWLIESSDVATAAHYLRSLGLTVVTPSGFSPQAATSLVDTDVFLGGVSLVGFGLLAAATASLAQARRRQNGVLTSVGVDVRSIRAVWVIHAAISAVLGCAVGIVAGYVVTVSGVWWFSRSLNQDMGPLAIAWGSTAVIAAGASLVVLLVSAGTVPLPRRASAPEKPVGAQQLARSHFGGFPSVIARRMRRRSRGVRLVGMV
ncbi:ABC transporter permease, partial [Pseudomonadaceae bacterium Sa2CUA2]